MVQSDLLRRIFPLDSGSIKFLVDLAGIDHAALIRESVFSELTVLHDQVCLGVVLARLGRNSFPQVVWILLQLFIDALLDFS